jgi:hypothetical protein
MAKGGPTGRWKDAPAISGLFGPAPPDPPIGLRDITQVRGFAQV